MGKTPNKLKFWWFGLITLVLGLFVTGVCYLFFSYFSNQANDKWVKSNDNFKIQALRKTTVEFEYRFVFQTTINGSDEWRTIYIKTQDAPQPISEKNVQIINENTGYFYFGDVFFITKDKGQTWTSFDIGKNSNFGKENSSLARIEKVDINNDGSGMILVVNIILKNTAAFHTTDFGQSWEESAF